jgi:nucleoside-diphosphate-sugar epimerase
MENPIDTHEVNVNGTLNVLEACRLNKVKRLIFASSSAVYGDQEIVPIVEGAIEKPISPYGAHKYIGEVYCGLYSRICGLETVSLRYFNVYGPRQSHTGAYASVIARFVDLKKNGKPLTVVGDGNQLRSYVHVYDIVQANILAMKSQKVGHGEFMNIGAKEEHSVNQIAGMIGGDVVFIDPRVEPKVSSADISKARDLLDWEPRVEFDQGLIELKRYNNLD